MKELVLEGSDKIIGYAGKREQPLTAELLNAKLERAEEDYKTGRITADEDFAKEIENW